MPQVVDDMALLNEMMSDIRSCDPLFQPTNYWAFYEKKFLPELESKGLRDFRSRKDSILSSFGASDFLPSPKLRLKRSFRGAARLGRMLSNLLESSGLFQLFIPEISPQHVTPLLFAYVESKFEKIGLDLRKCPTSDFGNPEDSCNIGGRTWSTAHLQYCSMFADAARYLALSEESVVCELGSGMGRNIEVMANLYGGATFLVFDIPPQLYIANQYLKAVFGERVISYEEAKLLDPADPTTAKRIKGKVVMLPTWRMPAWSEWKIDIFWNSASFQEMEPNVVLNYLKLVKTMRPQWVYINALPEGNYWGEWKAGRGGVKDAITEAHYSSALIDSYCLKQTYETDYFFKPRDYRSYVFESR